MVLNNLSKVRGPALALLVAVVALAFLLAEAACGEDTPEGASTGSPSEDTAGGASTSPPEDEAGTLGEGDDQPARVEIMGEPLWPTFYADSIDTLNRQYPLVFLGRVETQEKGLRELSPGESGGPPPDPLTISVIRVVEVVAGSGVSAGDEVRRQQTGERARDASGQMVVSHMEGDELLSIGREYVFFARFVEENPGYVVAAPFGVFTNSGSDGTLTPLCACWSWLTAVEALSGLTLPEVAQAVELAR